MGEVGLPLLDHGGGAFQLVGKGQQHSAEPWEDVSLEGSVAGWDRDTGRPRVLRFPPSHKIKPMRNNQGHKEWTQP